MTALVATDRVTPQLKTDVMAGVIRWDPVQSLWTLAHMLGGVVGVIWFTTPGAIAAFVLLTALTICAGHSVGMHRLLIHRSFATHKWVEYALVWLGVLVGMAGPFGMIRAHDMRDWHQRQAKCPPHPSHGAGPWRDAWWQMHCRYVLQSPPQFKIEPEVAQDPVYRWLERWWRWQQVPLALLLFALGGLGWVLWAVCLRVAVSLIGHWAVGHLAHRPRSTPDAQGWHIAGLPVQGYNVSGLGLITFGENWHGNHHAFPHSARLGLDPGQRDPGFLLVRVLERLGLAWNIKLPQDQPPCDGLTRNT